MFSQQDNLLESQNKARSTSREQLEFSVLGAR